MKKLFLSLGAASLAWTPIAASAATRASDVVPSSANVSRAVAGVEKIERGGGGDGIGIAGPLALILLTILVTVIAEDDNDSDG